MKIPGRIVIFEGASRHALENLKFLLQERGCEVVPEIVQIGKEYALCIPYPDKEKETSERAAV